VAASDSRSFPSTLFFPEHCFTYALVNNVFYPVSLSANAAHAVLVIFMAVALLRVERLSRRKGVATGLPKDRPHS
jgi:hypothetical protein